MKRIPLFVFLFALGIGLAFVANAARDASGNYTIPNTFTSGTVISSASMNANFADIATAMADSLSRSGKGGMTAALRGTDGTNAAPAYSFTSETSAGIYRNGAGDIRVAVGASDSIVWKQNQSLFPSGAVGLPAISWAAEPTSGFYRAGVGDIRLAVGGADATKFGAGYIRAPSGAVGAPSVSFTAETTTGFYLPGVGDLRLSIAGADSSTYGAGYLRVPAGTNGAPGLGFVAETGAGLYRNGVGDIRVAVAGTDAAVFKSSQTLFPNGAVGSPSIAIATDPTTGFYRIAASDIGLTVGGTLRFEQNGAVTHVGKGGGSLSVDSGAGYIASSTPVTLFEVYLNALLATGTTYGGHKPTKPFTVTHVHAYASVVASGAGNDVFTITDGTNTCTATFNCATDFNTTGAKRVAVANGAGTGCVYAADAALSISLTTAGCATTQGTVKNVGVVGKWQ